MLRPGNFGRTDVHSDNAFPPAGITLPGTSGTADGKKRDARKGG